MVNSWKDGDKAVSTMHHEIMGYVSNVLSLEPHQDRHQREWSEWFFFFQNHQKCPVNDHGHMIGLGGPHCPMLKVVVVSRLSSEKRPLMLRTLRDCRPNMRWYSSSCFITSHSITIFSGQTTWLKLVLFDPGFAVVLGS